ncbi:MAG: SEC-C domain-containing protein [Clostridia bacterium]|nr:SEC-C domain-containing protein [Clostridia bacterium]
MFEEMIDRVQTTTISRLLKGRIVRVQNGQPVPMAPARPARPAADPNTGLSPMNPAIAKRAQEVMQERIKAREAAEKENGTDGGNGNGGNGGLTPAANATPAANTSGPVIGDAPEPPKDLMANIAGKQQPKVASKNSKVCRNDPCPCGSGKKYKDCCYWNDNK